MNKMNKILKLLLILPIYFLYESPLYGCDYVDLIQYGGDAKNKNDKIIGYSTYDLFKDYNYYSIEPKIPLKVRVKITADEYTYINNVDGDETCYKVRVKLDEILKDSIFSEGVFSRVFSHAYVVDYFSLPDTVKDYDLTINANIRSIDEVVKLELLVMDAKSNNIIEQIEYETNLTNKYKSRKGPIVHLQLAYRDFMEEISKSLYLKKAKFENIVSQISKPICLSEKDKLSEQFVDFKYQEYPSKCEKYSDGFQIMDSMVKLYKDCPDLDKGTGKRVQFKEQFYKLRNLKKKHCN